MEKTNKYTYEICTSSKWVDIKIYEPYYATNNVIWDEAKELLKDNDLWDSYSEHYRRHYHNDSHDDEDEFELYFRHAKRIYSLNSVLQHNEHWEMPTQENNEELSVENEESSKTEKKLVIYSPNEALYKYIYRPDYCHRIYSEHKGYSVVLPIDEIYDGFIIILLENDNVIVGRHGRTEFGCEVENCYYLNNTKQVSFDKLDEPFKSLVTEKLLDEKQKGLNMINLLHLLPKEK